MTDRELLELAAKAAGIDHPGGEHSVYNDGRLWDCNALRWWNPLTDDGDALRLAVKLRITVEQNLFETKACAYVPIGTKRQHFVSESGNVTREEATRRAIVRAAAAIGKEMS